MKMMSLSPSKVLNLWYEINLHLRKCSPENLMNSSFYPLEVAGKPVRQQVYLVSSSIRQLCVSPENLLST